MNLYKIIFEHSGPKSQETGIKEYVLAENSTRIYEYIDDKYCYGCWSDYPGLFEICGDINDEDYDFSDAYYGITLYGWELVKENIEDCSSMIELGVVKIID